MVDAILFSDRCAINVPPVAKRYEPAHGVFIGISVASKITAAATDVKAGSLHHGPFAVLPFCGYNTADYWDRWLEMQDKLDDKSPEIYQINWFHKNKNGNFMQPGYSDNVRVLDWIVHRATGEAEAIDDVTGRHPKFEDFSPDGLDIDKVVWAEPFVIDPNTWVAEIDGTEEYFSQFGDKPPAVITGQLAELRERIIAARA